MTLNIENLRIGEPTGDLPKSHRTSEQGPDEISRKLIAAVMGLRDGEYLPVQCGSLKEASLLRGRGSSGTFRRFGITSKQRGMVVYFTRNGTH